MRSLLLVCVALGALVAACDPVWHVDNVATAHQPATPTDACVEAAVKEAGFKFSDVSGQVTKRPARDWYVNSVRVQWDPKMPTTIKLGVEGVGTEPPPGGVERYRTTREALIAKLGQTCGAAFDVSAETCGRVKDCQATPPAAAPRAVTPSGGNRRATPTP